jgi:hypothetical protein
MSYTLLNGHFDREPWEQQHAAGRYNPAITYRWHGQVYTLGCGETDDIYPITNDESLFVLSTHNGLNYASLAIFDQTDTAPFFEISLEEQDLPEDFFDMGWLEQLEHLQQYYS